MCIPQLNPIISGDLAPGMCQIAGNLAGLVTVEKGISVRVHGFLQSRDYEESLADFLKDARGAELPLPENLNPATLRAPRGTTEVIARRIMNQRNGSKNHPQ